MLAEPSERWPTLSASRHRLSQHLQGGHGPSEETASQEDPCDRLTCVPQNSCVHALSAVPQHVYVFGDRAFRGAIKLKWDY